MNCRTPRPTTHVTSPPKAAKVSRSRKIPVGLRFFLIFLTIPINTSPSRHHYRIAQLQDQHCLRSLQPSPTRLTYPSVNNSSSGSILIATTRCRKRPVHKLLPFHLLQRWKQRDPKPLSNLKSRRWKARVSQLPMGVLRSASRRKSRRWTRPKKVQTLHFLFCDPFNHFQSC